MKKVLKSLLCIIVICSLTACFKPKIEAGEDSFLVDFTIDSPDDIFAIQLEYYINDEAVGGGNFQNADESNLTKNDAYTWEFTKKDFPEDSDLSGFSMKIVVLDKNQNEFPCKESITLATEFNNTYQVNITGNYKDGFDSKLKE